MAYVATLPYINVSSSKLKRGIRSRFICGGEVFVNRKGREYLYNRPDGYGYEKQNRKYGSQRLKLSVSCANRRILCPKWNLNSRNCFLFRGCFNGHPYVVNEKEKTGEIERAPNESHIIERDNPHNDLDPVRVHEPTICVNCPPH